MSNRSMLKFKAIIHYSEMDQQEVLTPGHFLIGRPPLEIVEPMEDEKIGNLDRWRLIQKTRKDFWVKWK